MNKDFAPFELAVKLKGKGFDYPCIGHYVNNQLYIAHYLNAFHSDNNESVDAPTISQVLKWLREEKEIDIVIYPIDACTVFMGGEKYILSVYISRKRDYKLHHDNKDKYVEWEDAAIAGIEYVLDNLI